MKYSYTENEAKVDSAFELRSAEYNSFGLQLLQRYAPSDPTSLWALNEISKINDKIHDASKGRINLKRSLLKQEIKEDMKRISNEYRLKMYNAFLEKMDSLKEHTKTKTKKGDTTRLADLMEAQLKYKAMSNHELNLFLANLQEEKDIVKKGMALGSHYDVQAIIAELRSRGEDDLAATASTTLSAIPKEVIGDPKALEILKEAERYSSKPDPTAVYVFDEKGSPIGIDLTSIIDYSPLEVVPE